MKIILDTNVILSAFLTEGLSNKLLDISVEKFETIISGWIIEEVTEILERKFHTPKTLIKDIILFLENSFELIEPIGKLPNVCRDPDDNNILQLAEFPKADIIITGDKDLLVLKSYKKCKILSPRDFMEKYLS